MYKSLAWAWDTGFRVYVYPVRSRRVGLRRRVEGGHGWVYLLRPEEGAWDTTQGCGRVVGAGEYRRYRQGWPG